MIDLRSDTVTRPTDAMRTAMARAEVGDDVYGEDPTVRRLEERVAGLFGHEAALFTPTGSLANVLAVRTLVGVGQEVLCESSAHIARAELGAHAALGGVTMRTFPSDRGRVDPDRVAEIIAPDAGPYLVSTAAVAVENTHNFGGGTVQPIDRLRAVAELCRDHGLGLHLDGARIWNAHVATGTPLAEYGRLCDTVSVCFSKGLGAPVGSMLLADADRIARARVLRKRLGAGWRQAGMLAAAARYAVDHQLSRLADDHAAARAFAEAVAEAAPAAVDPDTVETNIVILNTGDRPAVKIAAAAAEQGVAVSALGARMVRAVTHLDVDTGSCAEAGKIIGALIGGPDVP
ncbi:MAG TPA: GntG family PLP-dependent aldolase [Microlunatus sp.]|nr:GntG family PLP-dependent aldolase [Microlunatus sp.]